MHRQRDTQIYRLHRQIYFLSCGLLVTPIQASVNTGFCVQTVLHIYFYLVPLVYYSLILPVQDCYYSTITFLPLFTKNTIINYMYYSSIHNFQKKNLKHEKENLTIPVSRCYVHRQPFHRQITSALQTVSDDFQQGSKQKTRYDFISF